MPMRPSCIKLLIIRPLSSFFFFIAAPSENIGVLMGFLVAAISGILINKGAFCSGGIQALAPDFDKKVAMLAE